MSAKNLYLDAVKMDLLDRFPTASITLVCVDNHKLSSWSIYYTDELRFSVVYFCGHLRTIEEGTTK